MHSLEIIIALNNQEPEAETEAKEVLAAVKYAEFQATEWLKKHSNKDTNLVLVTKIEAIAP